MTTLNSFSFLGSASATSTTAKTGEAKGWASQPASESQINWYKKLCEQKDEPVNELLFADKSAIGKEIEKLMKINRPSKMQMELIQKKLDNIATFGIELTFEVPVLTELTGGKEGTASKFIEFLIGFERDNYDKALPTEKQLQRLCEYYLCEEVAFEEYDVARRISVDESKGYWRKLTVEEFVNELNNKLNRRTASDIIEKYSPIHLAWKQKRATIEQRKYIMELQERMAFRYKPRVIETGVTFEGETFEFTTDVHETGSREYQSLTELELYMMSQDQAPSSS